MKELSITAKAWKAANRQIKDPIAVSFFFTQASAIVPRGFATRPARAFLISVTQKKIRHYSQSTSIVSWGQQKHMAWIFLVRESQLLHTKLVTPFLNRHVAKRLVLKYLCIETTGDTSYFRTSRLTNRCSVQGLEFIEWKRKVYLRSSAAYLANFTVMKLRLFRRLFRLHHSCWLLLLPYTYLVFPALSRRLMLMMLLLNKGCSGVVNSSFVSLRLITARVSSRRAAIIWRVVRACLLVSWCLRTSAGIGVGDSRGLRRIRLWRMRFRNDWSGAYRCWVNTCSWCWIGRFSCCRGVLTIVSTLATLNIRSRLLWIIRRLRFISFSIVVLSRAVVRLISGVSRLIRGICWWRRRWSVLLSRCVAISACLSRRSLLSVSCCAGWIGSLYNLPRCLSLLRNIMCPSRCRGLNSVSCSCLRCSVTCLYRRILSLSKSLRVLASRSVTVVVARGHVGRKRKKARVQDVKPTAQRRRGTGL